MADVDETVRRFLEFMRSHDEGDMLYRDGLLHTPGCTKQGGQKVGTELGTYSTAFGACCAQSFDLSMLVDALEELVGEPKRSGT